MKEMIFLLTTILLLLGGSFIILLYNTYLKTRQKFLLILSFGFFLLVVGGSLPVLTFALSLSKELYVLGTILQIFGISAIFYATVR
ncbi:MAG: hypothetical protein QXM23_05440 [Archaeoglobaceae archaeon]|uniref:Uncharacterized protein n=1 Tax=Archaeoglobus fulgidus TaxID=2234 RepID=A0A7J3M2P8_ARCFL